MVLRRTAAVVGCVARAEAESAPFWEKPGARVSGLVPPRRLGVLVGEGFEVGVGKCAGNRPEWCDAWTTRVRRPERTDFVHIHTSRVFFAAVMDAHADSGALLASLTSPTLGSSVFFE